MHVQCLHFCLSTSPSRPTPYQPPPNTNHHSPFLIVITTNSRRVYDAIAAGCVPVMISDGTNLPFHSSLDWPSFSVTIPEATLMKGPEHARPIFEALLRDTKVEGGGRK